MFGEADLRYFAERKAREMGPAEGRRAAAAVAGEAPLTAINEAWRMVDRGHEGSVRRR